MSYGGELVVDAGEPIGGHRLGLGVAFNGGFLRPGEWLGVRDLGGVETVVVAAPAPTNEPIANRTTGDHSRGRLARGAGHSCLPLKVYFF